MTELESVSMSVCVCEKEREREGEGGKLGPCITHTGVLHAGGQQGAGSGLPVCDTQGLGC